MHDHAIFFFQKINGWKKSVEREDTDVVRDTRLVLEYSPWNVKTVLSTQSLNPEDQSTLAKQICGLV